MQSKNTKMLQKEISAIDREALEFFCASVLYIHRFYDVHKMIQVAIGNDTYLK